MWSFSIFYWVALALPLYAMYASYKALLTPGTADDTHASSFFIPKSYILTIQAFQRGLGRFICRQCCAFSTGDCLHRITKPDGTVSYRSG